MNFLDDNCTLSYVKERGDISDFSCGDNDLDEFFSNDCYDYDAQLLGKTYCFKLESDRQQTVCAFTLANASIRVSDLPNARKKKIESDIPHVKALKDYPAVLVARLGVSASFRSLHIGSEALTYIKLWFLDPFNKTGCRFIIVDAYNNEETMSFYIRNGFKPVFGSEEQERSYRHIAPTAVLNTRLMYFDLMTAANCL